MKVRFKIEREMDLPEIETDNETIIDDRVREHLAENCFDIITDGKIEYEIIEWKRCPMFSVCNCKTAICQISLPDEGCYWYRYFKKRIEEVKKNEK